MTVLGLETPSAEEMMPGPVAATETFVKPH
jgi:hypothetical protein